MKKWLSPITQGVLFSILLWQQLELQGTAATQVDQEPRGYAQIARLSSELYSTLEKRQQRSLHPVPILLEQMQATCVQPGPYTAGTNILSAVYISPGFIELLDRLSYAMAVDASRRGYLQECLNVLCAEDHPANLRAVSPLPTATLDTENLQASEFNQMAGSLMAINQAYHYLGYYRKYAAQLAAPSHPPLTSLLTPGEWHKAVICGSRSALSCGLGVEGIKHFYDALASMPTQPAWTRYFLPKDANIRKVKTDLDKLDGYFFADRKNL